MRVAQPFGNNKNAKTATRAMRNNQGDPRLLNADILQPRRVLAMLGARTFASIWVGVYACKWLVFMRVQETLQT